MKKSIALSLLLASALSPRGLLTARQGDIEEKQPTFAEALQFFQQLTEKKATIPTTRPKKIDMLKKQAAVAEKPTNISALQTQINTLETENKKLMRDLSSLQQQHERVQGDYDALTVQLREEQEKNSQLREKLTQTAQSDEAFVAEQLLQATKEITQLQEMIARLTQERDQSIQAAQEKDTRISVLQKQLKQQTVAPVMPPTAPPPTQAKRPEPTAALQKHLAAIRAGTKLKPAEERALKAKPEQAGILGTLAAGLQRRFGWMWGEEEPEEKWDNQIEDQLQTP